MNYMKILLIYMAAAMSLAVQSTTAPTETPVPTPAAVVEQQTEETAAPVQSGTEAAITETPAAPSETPPPVPEITPNKKYHNLKKGDKGREVKSLQERLIELGYLPEGSADGNYGNQTYKAVRNFQYYNGLSRDGIAGKRTQTYLYENPDVNPYPKGTPTPPAASVTTEAPSEKATPEEIPETTPAETPTEEPTPEVTVISTEEPTEKTTEEPTELTGEENQETNAVDQNIYGYKIIVEDDADLLSEEEEIKLYDKMAPVTEYGNVAFKTTNDNNSSIEVFAGQGRYVMSTRFYPEEKEIEISGSCELQYRAIER